MTEYLAKSEKYGKETIEKHTLNLVKNHGIIKNIAKNSFFDENFWELSKLACFLHDLGKYNDKFQEKIAKEDYNINGEIPHAFLSVAYIPKTINQNDILPLFYAIAYHHNRKIKFTDEEYKNTIINDLTSKLNELEWLKKKNINITSLTSTFFSLLDKSGNNYKKLINSKNKDIYNKFIYLKGLLHKCDYSASAHITPEKTYDKNYNTDFESWQSKQSWSLAPFQEKAQALARDNKSIVLVASTGVGKTEYSMNWIDGKKAFYLLGLRMATNKMYERFLEIFKKDNVTLLHSNASDILTEDLDTNYGSIFNYFEKRTQAKQLSYPITIATADQLVTSVFKYPGFELKYFTASYSRIVVDEIQSFAPEAIASIVVFLQEIHRLGGRFLLMTATLPSFVKDDLKNLGDIEFPEDKDQLSEKKRHKIKLLDIQIEENILNYIQKDKKILIICNTVKKAQEIATILEDEYPKDSIKLLHSKFIVKDRKLKENDIMKDASNGKDGKKEIIWISTQIVEASLDIDFDILLTENATIDSLFQRFGRCYRSRDYKKTEPNIFIFKNDEVSKMIYDKEIMNRSWNILHNYDEKLITENDKINIINEVFDNDFIKTTKYYEKYNKYKEALYLGMRAENKSEAQYMFRKITNNYLVIPQPTYIENMDTIDSLLKTLDKENKDIENKEEFWRKRVKAEKDLMSFTIGVQLWKPEKRLDEDFFNSKFLKKRKITLLTKCEYSPENGLILLKENESYNNLI